MARSRSGTRNTRGPRKPRRRPAIRRASSGRRPLRAGCGGDPRFDHGQGARGAHRRQPADIIRELIKSGIFATINQVIDRDTAALVTSDLGYEVAEARPVGATGRRPTATRAAAPPRTPSSRKTIPTSSSRAPPS